MCACETNNVNGQPGYSWDGKSVGIRPLDPPDLITPDDELLFDLPGRCRRNSAPNRCDGTDSHCHHFRIVKSQGIVYLLTRNGSGDHKIKLGHRPGLVNACQSLTEEQAYWLCQSIYHSYSHDLREAVQNEANKWRQAFVDKRIKKQKRKGKITVWIDP